MDTITIAELKASEKQLEEEIQEKQQLLESLRRTREYIQHGSQPPTAQKRPRGVGKSKYGRYTELVRQAIKSMTKNYTFKDIESFLAEAGTPLPNSAISGVINRLRLTGEMKEFRKGAGRRAAIYKP